MLERNQDETVSLVDGADRCWNKNEISFDPRRNLGGGLHLHSWLEFLEFQRPRSGHPRPEIASPDRKGIGDLLEDYERFIVRSALRSAMGTLDAAAQLLRVDRTNLYGRLNTLGLLHNFE